MLVAWVIALVVACALVLLCCLKVQWSGPVAGIILAIALPTCMYDTYLKDPYELAWLCNYTALTAIILLFWFNKVLYDFLFFYAWIGSMVPLLVPKNSYVPEETVFMLAYLLKHLLPAVIALYFMRVKKRKISSKALYYAFSGLLLYIAIMFVYNLAFQQNILQLMYPSVEILQYLGPWPIYNLVNLALAFAFFNLLFLISKKCKLVENVQEKEIETKKE